jgi:RsiW-degrading membrane proteinase PrsW (M82 family)
LVHAVLGRPDLWGVMFTGILLALIAGSPAILLSVYLDRREPEPWWLLGMAFLWGAVVATVMAVILEGLVDEWVASRFDATASLVDTSGLGYQFASLDVLFVWLQSSLIAPVIEEGLKALALVFIFLLLPTEATSMRDGIIYGALIGLGFAVLETAAFVTSAHATSGSAEYLSQLIPRFVLFGVNGHALYAALFGAALGYARQSAHYAAIRKGLIIAGGFILALAGHAMANAFGPFALSAFVTVTGAGPTVTVAQLWVLNLAALIATNVWVYVIAVSVTVRSGYWELHVCQTELADEGPLTITPDEYALVQAEGIWRLRRVPWLPSRQSARLVRAQNELAFRRHDVRRAGADPTSDHMVEQWRDVISELREPPARRVGETA